MFTRITLKNFRTHKLTTIELQPVTLLIGNNNSGKTNLLAGIQHFSNLVKRGDPSNKEQDRIVSDEDFFPHRYRLAEENEPMSIVVEWNRNQDSIQYEMELYVSLDFNQGVCCKEKISIQFAQESEIQQIEYGHNEVVNSIELRSKIKNNNNIDEKAKLVYKIFFYQFSDICSYHFQSSFLKGLINRENVNSIDNLDDIKKKLGYEGENLKNIISYLKNNKDYVFSEFLALMRRFESSFIGVRYDSHYKQLLWEFDFNKHPSNSFVNAFPSDVVSDGFMKAAAIGLLISLQRPPSLILIEEIENGINPGNIQELMRWIWQATASKDNAPQFILTSHSPSVLREFYNHLDAVYTVRLNKRTYQSDVRNLNQALDVLIGIGTIEGEIIEDEKTGKRLIEIPQYQLAELWYSGTIG